MRVAFNLVAALLLGAAIWLQVTARPLPGAPDPEAIARLAHGSGYRLAARGMLQGRETWMRFDRPGCSPALTVAVLPSVYRQGEARTAIAWLRQAAGPATLIFAGRPVASIHGPAFTLHWLRIKAATYLGLRQRSSWDSSALAVAVSPACRPAPIDWAQLESTTAQPRDAQRP